MQLSNNTLLQGGKYRIVRFISAGGFGCTYEAEHVMLNKRVAIKEFFVKDFCNRDESTSHVTVGTQTKVALVSKLKKKFLEEAIALNRFHNENIVQVTDVFEENGTAYYVMDYINGKSIHDILKTENTIAESRAVKYICQVANALKYVHSQNRLHLDIKPGNIMIDEYDNAILIDFGASKQYDEESGENTSTLLGKTPGYAPIEQMGNSVQTFTPATDIYSLGATLYKMLSGITPPEANILVADDGSLKPLPSNISAETRKAVEQAMKVKRKERPQSVDDFIGLLTISSNEYTIIDEGKEEKISPVAVKPKPSKKPKKNMKNVKSEVQVKEKEWEKSSEIDSDILELLPKAKYGFWLNLFLIVVGLGGVLGAALAVIRYNENATLNGSETLAVGDVVLSVMMCLLALFVVYTFRKRKSDAVFLSKLYLILSFAVNLIGVVGGDNETVGIVGLPQMLKSLIWTVIWYVYICVSKRVEEVVPSSCRKVLKRDYIIVASFVIFAILFFGVASSEIEKMESQQTEQVEDEVYEDQNGNQVTYTGEVRDGVPNGYGKAIYSYGEYEGEFLDGLRHGEGKFKDAYGAVFTGSFEYDDYSEGRYEMKDGVHFVGTFKDKQPYNGVWYERNGVYISTVKNGK